MKLLFFDLETTGVKFWRNGIHQIGGIVDIDGQEAERFDIRLAPNPAATIEQEALGIRSFIVNNSMAIRRRLFPDLEDYEHIGYDGGSKDMINRKRLIGNTYQIYRSILHQLAIDENWNNVYSDMTLPSGDMGTIKVERVDDDKDNDI